MLSLFLWFLDPKSDNCTRQRKNLEETAQQKNVPRLWHGINNLLSTLCCTCTGYSAYILPWNVTMVYCTWNKKICIYKICLFTCSIWTFYLSHTWQRNYINTYNITLLFPYPYFSLGISFPSMDKLGTPKSICPFNIFLKHFLVMHITQKIIFCIPEM